MEPMGYNGGLCYYCGFDLSLVWLPLDGGNQVGLTRDECSEVFYAHMDMKCAGVNDYMSRRSDITPRCNMEMWHEHKKYRCTQKSHPRNKHNGKSWNVTTGNYEFFSWECVAEERITMLIRGALLRQIVLNGQ